MEGFEEGVGDVGWVERNWLMVTERDAYVEMDQVRAQEISLLDCARKIHQWATYADEALMKGDVSLGRACIAVVLEMTKR